MKNNQVKILLATYDGDQYIEDQINALLDQTYKNWELLVHDDNSTDHTVKIIREYSKKYPDKIKFIDDDRSFGSAYENFSFLLNQVRSDYIMFCDQDDIWLPNKIEVTLKEMKSMEGIYGKGKPLLVHTDLTVIDEYENTLADSFWQYQHIDPYRDSVNFLIFQNVVTGCTVMINRKLADLALPMPKDIIMHDWWMALVASVFGKIGIVHGQKVLYRQHSTNDTGAKKFDMHYWLERVKIRPTLDKYIRQANVFGDRFWEQLEEKDQKIFRDLKKWETAGFFEKRSMIIRHSLWKHGLIRNIGLLVFA